MSSAALDPGTLRGMLSAWAQSALADRAPVIIRRVESAPGGASSETYLIDAATGPDRSPGAWVLRVEPRGHQVYEDPSVERQYRVIRALSEHTDLPVPAAIALETEADVLGAPFFLMQRANGAAPPNDYHRQGLLASAAPAERERMWRESVALLARLHSVEPGPFAFLAYSGQDPKDGLAQELARWQSYRDWSRVPELPVYERAREWLDGGRPGAGELGFAWGDARLPNILFARGRPSALLDWETASLGGAETDLGWWLFYDRMITEAEGVPRLSGIGDAGQTVALWESCSGRKGLDLEWHVIFAGYRFALISERARLLAIEAGRLPAGQHGQANPAVRLLERLLAEHGG